MIRANAKIDANVFDAVFSAIAADVDAGLSEVASVVLDEAKASSDFIDRTGNLRKSIRKRKSRFENGGYIVFARGANNKDSESESSKGYHAHLVEFGHVLVAWGRVTGKRVLPHPFLRNARTKGFQRAMEIFRSGKR